jgi:hypothetical protein
VVFLFLLGRWAYQGTGRSPLAVASMVHGRTGRRASQIKGRRRSVCGAAGALLLFLLLGSPAQAAEVRLRIDELSFFAHDGTESVVFPLQAVVRISYSKAGPDHWDLVLLPSSEPAVSIAFPSGRKVNVSLIAPTTGTLVVTERGSTCIVLSHLAAAIEGEATPRRFSLAFSTGTVSRRAGALEASRQGHLDLKSGYLELVAAAVSVQGAPAAKGEPFTLVLRGQLTDLPAEITALSR